MAHPGYPPTPQALGKRPRALAGEAEISSPEKRSRYDSDASPHRVSLPCSVERLESACGL